MVKDVVLKNLDIVITHSQCILLFTANKVTYIHIYIYIYILCISVLPEDVYKKQP